MLEKDTVSGHINCMRPYSGALNAQSVENDMRKSWRLCESGAILMREHGGYCIEDPVRVCVPGNILYSSCTGRNVLKLE
jgi:hypothetical protein